MGLKKKLSDMKISKRLMLSYVVVLVLLVIGIIVSIANLISIGDKIETFYEHPFQVSTAANTMDSEFESMQKSTFRALSTEDAAITEEAIEHVKTSAAAVQDNMAIVKELFLGDQSIVDSLQERLTALEPMRETVLELASQNRNVEAAAYMEEHNMAVIAEAQVYLDRLISESDTTGSNLINQVQSVQTAAIVILIILGIASVIVSLLFAKVITSTITAPVDELEIVAANLAVGKLEVEAITYEAKDEMGNLAANMKKAMTILRSIVKDVAYLTKEIAEGNFAVKTEQTEIYMGEFLPLLVSLRDMNSNLSNTMGQINDASDQVTMGSTQMAEMHRALQKELRNRLEQWRS